MESEFINLISRNERSFFASFSLEVMYEKDVI